ncbi:Cysteine-rich venom protein helothermine, partial [Lamellibrachia satsuma]
MKAFILLAVTLVALLAYGATQESGEEWTVSVEEDTVGPESPLLDGNIEDLPNGGDSKADYQDGVGENAGGDASSRIRRAITGDISPVCGKVYKFNRAQKLAAVRTHNKMRRREGASDMIRLVWSSKMARRAHQWASQCMWKHGMLKDCDGKLVGQNLYMTKNGRYYPPVNVTRVIANGWWSEKKFYNYTTTKCKKNQMCGHYTQVVWGASYEVGCSIVHCPLVTVGVKTPWKKATIFACDYAPTEVRLQRRLPQLRVNEEWLLQQELVPLAAQILPCHMPKCLPEANERRLPLNASTASTVDAFEHTDIIIFLHKVSSYEIDIAKRFG